MTIPPFIPFNPADPIDPALGYMPETLPASVEIAPNVFVPDNRCDEVLEAIAADADLYEAINEIVLERESHDGLTDDDCVVVPFWFLAQVQRIMAHKLLEMSYTNTVQARKVHSVAAPFLNFGSR